MNIPIENYLGVRQVSYNSNKFVIFILKIGKYSSLIINYFEI